MTAKQIYIETIESAKNALRWMEISGCNGFDCSAETLATLSRWCDIKPIRVETLTDVRRDLGDCRRCKLSEGRTHIVYGEGDPNARLVFVGEGPGYEEDKSGLPFVGKAGQLLTKIISAMHLSRDQVYICNIIKCRPPGNRNPQPEEIVTCRPYLERQIEVIDPACICALGTFAAQTLLNTNRPISALRGRFHDYGGIQVMPTYHPAYLLRNPDQKRKTWEDVQKIMQLLG